eukprot:m.210695 g.210695  ORF g.210695 m.210695 type:complete len:65 (+) comp39745_c0_seq158:1802-1996(+)
MRDLGITCMMKGKLDEAKQLLTRAFEIIEICDDKTLLQKPPAQCTLITRDLLIEMKVLLKGNLH